MDKAHATMHIDEAKGRLKTRFQTAFILKVFRRRLRLSESWKQWFEQQKTRACVPHTPYMWATVCGVLIGQEKCTKDLI